MSPRLTSTQVWSGATLQRTVNALQATKPHSRVRPQKAIGEARRRSASRPSHAAAATAAITAAATCTRGRGGQADGTVVEGRVQDDREQGSSQEPGKASLGVRSPGRRLLSLVRHWNCAVADVCRHVARRRYQAS